MTDATLISIGTSSAQAYGFTSRMYDGDDAHGIAASCVEPPAALKRVVTTLLQMTSTVLHDAHSPGAGPADPNNVASVQAYNRECIVALRKIKEAINDFVTIDVQPVFDNVAVSRVDDDDDAVVEDVLLDAIRARIEVLSAPFDAQASTLDANGSPSPSPSSSRSSTPLLHTAFQSSTPALPSSGARISSPASPASPESPSATAVVVGDSHFQSVALDERPQHSSGAEGAAKKRRVSPTANLVHLRTNDANLTFADGLDGRSSGVQEESRVYAVGGTWLHNATWM